MKVALWPLRMKVVSANAASPSGAGSATGKGSTGATRTSSATTAMRASSISCPTAGRRTRRGRAAQIFDFRSTCFGTYLNLASKLGIQVVRVLREVLRALRGDENEALEPAAAEALAVEARLDGDHVSRDQLAA